MLASFSFHEQQAGHSDNPPQSVGYVHEVVEFVEDSATVGTNQEGFFNLAESSTSSEDSSGDSDVDKNSSQVIDMESSPCEPDLTASSSTLTPDYDSSRG